MIQLRRFAILSVVATAMLVGFSSCKKEYSPDDPLPDVYTSTIFISSDNRIVYALDKETGKRKWEFETDNAVVATMVLQGDHLFVGTMGGWLYDLNKKDGKLRSKRKFGSAIVGTPMVYEDKLIVATKTDSVQALLVDSITADPVWKVALSAEILTSPAIHTVAGLAEVGVFISTSANKVVALDVADGSTLWTYTDGANPGAYNSSPCVVNDSFLYVGNTNGRLYALNTLDGTKKWTFATNGEVNSSPISIGGNVIVGSNDRYLYSIDSASGLLRWKVKTNERIISSPVIDNQYVYFGSYDFNLYCVDIIDGILKWKKQTYGLVKSSPVVDNGMVYVGSYDKNLYAIDTVDGATKWLYNVNGQIQTSPIIDNADGKVVVPSTSGSYPY